MFTEPQRKKIANIIKSGRKDLIVTYSTGTPQIRNAVVDGFVKEFQKSHPKFNRDKFLVACGIGS